MIVLMKLRKDTKNTHVYEEVESNGDAVSKIPSLYIRKAAFPGNPPKAITVTVEPSDV